MRLRESSHVQGCERSIGLLGYSEAQSDGTNYEIEIPTDTVEEL